MKIGISILLWLIASFYIYAAPPGSKALSLVKAYPEFLESFDKNKIKWKDGSESVYDDQLPKTTSEKMDNADFEDQMFMSYIRGKIYPVPLTAEEDAGRIRNDDFFRKMYGNSPAEVEKNLVAVYWTPSGKKYRFTKINGVSEKIKLISAELALLPPEYQKYVTNIAGSYYWRNIAGTKRLSTHSFGIAIDINTAYSHYWRNDKPMKYQNKIPMKIVEIFERHGFIWGGKWNHYDTMHFEYRPEIINTSKIMEK